MKRFCLGTSGVSNPLNAMPFDLYEGIWVQVFAAVEAGAFAVTPEIYGELIRLKDEVGDCFRENPQQLILDVGTRPGIGRRMCNTPAGCRTHMHHTFRSASAAGGGPWG